MPDDLDYAWLDSLLARPDTWTADDLAAARSLIESQRRALVYDHPRDDRGRRSHQEVLDLLEAAVQAHLHGSR